MKYITLLSIVGLLWQIISVEGNAQEVTFSETPADKTSPSNQPSQIDQIEQNAREVRDAFEEVVWQKALIAEIQVSSDCGVGTGNAIGAVGSEASGSEEYAREILRGHPAGEKHLNIMIGNLINDDPRGDEVLTDLSNLENRIRTSRRAGEFVGLYNTMAKIEILATYGISHEIFAALGRSRNIGCFEKLDSMYQLNQCVDLNGDGNGWLTRERNTTSVQCVN